MTPVLAALFALLPPAAPGVAAAAQESAAGSGAAEPALMDGDVGVREAAFVLDFGPTRPVLRLPRDEKLVYDVYVDLALFETTVGTVTQSSAVEPYQRSVLLVNSGEEDENLETATLTIKAKGRHSLYNLDSTIESRILPQGWPRIMQRNSQAGTENRRREVMIGIRDGKPTSSYRKDTTKGAPKGTRIWRDPHYREVPEGTVDMLSAVYFVRTLIADDELESVSFPLLEKSRVWELTLRRGQTKRIETPAGTFDAVEVLLEPKPYEGEQMDEDDRKRFEGLFGLHGTIHLWVEQQTGVPIRIQGDLPAGWVTLGVDVILKSFEGTPPEFAPL